MAKISQSPYNNTVSKLKITIIGKLRYSETEGLQGCISDFSLTKARQLGLLHILRKAHQHDLLEVLPDAYDWPGIPQITDNAQRIEKERYVHTLHADATYTEAARRFFDEQQRDPKRLSWGNFWGYKGKILRFVSDEPETDVERTALLVKHYVLRREHQFDKVQREIETLENLEKLESISREPITESVRLFVWQRDKGQCVKCGSQERLEFDHIIPVARGGSNTERNIQLLCEPCNRSKGANV